MKPKLVPLRLGEAKEHVRRLHRHNDAPLSWLFGVGVELDGELVGVGIAGRPAARALDNGRTVEITRICTTGVPNVCSMLYGALSRAAFALGYSKVVTYTLQSENGASLKGLRACCRLRGASRLGFPQSTEASGPEPARRQKPMAEGAPMTADEDTPMESVQKRLVDAARAIVKGGRAPLGAFYWIPARSFWDLQDAVNDYDLEMGDYCK